ncbi:hypothetical protein BH10PSE13_BH10PSE13_22180 [soil metagenome]
MKKAHIMRISFSRANRVVGAATLGVIAIMVSAASTADRGFTSDEPTGKAVPWTATPADDGGPLRFVVVGDRTGVARIGVFPEAMRQISWLRPDFTISVGDMIEGYSEDKSEIGRQWDELIGYTRALGGPFIAVPGNHDISNAASAETWRERFGRPNYAFMFKGALFVVLDSEETPQILPAAVTQEAHAMSSLATRDPDRYDREMADILADRAKKAAPSATPSELQAILTRLGSNYAAIKRGRAFSATQVDWVRGVLARHRDARWTFVFVHRPEWNSAQSGWSDIEAALQGRRHTVIGGHDHRFSRQVRSGTDYFQMGTTGGTAQQPGPGLMDHIMMVTLAEGQPAFANIRLDGLLDADGKNKQTRAY